MAASLIPVELPRLFQPHSAFGLAEDIAGYASSYLVGSAGGQTGDGKPITFGGGLTIGPTGQGLAYQGDGTDNIAYATPSKPFVFGTDKDFTFVVVARKRTAGVNGAALAGFGATGGSTGNTQFALFGSASDANAVRIVAVASDGTVYLNTDCTAFGFNDTLWHTIVVRGRVAHKTNDNGGATYFIDGKQLNTIAGLSDSNPTATTYNVVNACAVRRGGASIVAGPYDIALCLPLLAQMSDDWCLRASQSVWATCFEPQRIWVPVSTAVAGSHDTSGALASDAGTIAGTAAHLTLHAASGALASDAAAIAGTATHLTLHATSGALSSDAATIAGAAVHPHVATGALAADAAAIAGTADHAAGGEHATTGAMSAVAAAISGTAAHYTLHATSGGLAADAATVVGTATHLTLHTTSGALSAEAATLAGTAANGAATTLRGRVRRRTRTPIPPEDIAPPPAPESAPTIHTLVQDANELIVSKGREVITLQRVAESKRKALARKQEEEAIERALMEWF